MTWHLTVAWTVSAGAAPRPWLHCRGCGAVRPFDFGGKARLNANGGRLDGWLIYRCAVCDGTWNRPVIERQRAGEVDPGLLDALRQNSPDHLDRLARDVTGLRRHARRIDSAGPPVIARRTLARVPAVAAALVLNLRPVAATGFRIDRILAAGLCLGRARIAALDAAGRLRLPPGAGLRRVLKAPVRVDLELVGQPDAAAILAAAADP